MNSLCRKRWIISGTVLCLSAAGLWASDEKDKPRSVTVQGEGKVQAVPDIALLTLEVTLEGQALDSVATQVRQRMQKALATLRAQGVDDKDIQTLTYSVQPRFAYDKAGNSTRKGYSVTDRVAAKVRDLKKVGNVLTTVVDSGLTTVNGPDFNVDNPQALERQALAKAVDDAKAKAEILAHSANAVLGDVQTITQEGSPNFQRPRPMIMARMAAPLPNTEEPISAGEQSFAAGVTMTFALK